MCWQSRPFDLCNENASLCLYLFIYFYFFWFSLEQLLRNKLVAAARQSIRMNSNLGQLYRNMQEAYNEMQTPLAYQIPSALVNLSIYDFLWHKSFLFVISCLKSGLLIGTERAERIHSSIGL